MENSSNISSSASSIISSSSSSFNDTKSEDGLHSSDSVFQSSWSNSIADVSKVQNYEAKTKWKYFREHKTCFISLFLISMSLLIIFLSFVIIILISLCIYLVSEVTRLRTVEKIEEEYEYNFIESKFSSDEWTIGIATLPTKIDPQTTLDYFNDDSSVSIYNLEDSDLLYRCTATCSCESEDRRVASMVLQSGIALVTLAVGYFIAMDTTRNKVYDYCSEKFGDVCDSSHMKMFVDVGECVPEDVRKELEGVEKNLYLCRGECENYPNRPTNVEHFGEEIDEVQCDKLQLKAGEKAFRLEAATNKFKFDIDKFCLAEGLVGLEMGRYGIWNGMMCQTNKESVHCQQFMN